MPDEEPQRLTSSDFKRLRKKKIDQVYDEQKHEIEKIVKQTILRQTRCDDEKAEDLTKGILHDDVILGQNAGCEDEVDGDDDIEDLKEEYHNLNKQTRYLLLSAPLENVSGPRKKKLSLEEDEMLRQLQYSKFCDILDDIDKNVKPEVVKKGVEMYESISKFLFKHTACEYVIIFNGHGSSSGMLFQDENPQAISLDTVISEITALCEKKNKVKNVMLIFAQCYGHLHSYEDQQEEGILNVVNFTSSDKPKTNSTLKRNRSTGRLVESTHFELQTFAENRNTNMKNRDIHSQLPDNNMENVTINEEEHVVEKLLETIISHPEEDIPKKSSCIVECKTSVNLPQQVHDDTFNTQLADNEENHDEDVEGAINFICVKEPDTFISNGESGLNFSTQVSVQDELEVHDDSQGYHNSNYFNQAAYKERVSKFFDWANEPEDYPSLALHQDADDNENTDNGYDTIEDYINFRDTKPNEEPVETFKNKNMENDFISEPEYDECSNRKINNTKKELDDSMNDYGIYYDIDDDNVRPHDWVTQRERTFSVLEGIFITEVINAMLP